jgi:hypothetical protein
MQKLKIYAGSHGHNLMTVDGKLYGLLHVVQRSDKTAVYLADHKTAQTELRLPQRRYRIDSTEFEADVIAALKEGGMI